MTNAEIDSKLIIYPDRPNLYYALVAPDFSYRNRRHPLPDWLDTGMSILAIVRFWNEDRDSRIGLSRSHKFNPEYSLLYVPLASEIKDIYSQQYAVEQYPELVL